MKTPIIGPARVREADAVSGVFCETEIDECSSEPCQNGFSCVDTVNAYQCECDVGYTGGLDTSTKLPHKPCPSDSLVPDAILFPLVVPGLSSEGPNP